MPQTVTSMDTEVHSNSGVPTIILRDIQHLSYVQSSDHQLWYKNSDTFTQIKPCSILLTDIYSPSQNNNTAFISPCNSNRCKTCKILITDTSFNSLLTNKQYHTHGHGDLDCKSTNVVYGIECNLCGLVYVGETQGPLHKRINGHRSLINRGLQSF